jgi:hypothetical protein
MRKSCRRRASKKSPKARKQKIAEGAQAKNRRRRASKKWPKARKQKIAEGAQAKVVRNPGAYPPALH